MGYNTHTPDDADQYEQRAPDLEWPQPAVEIFSETPQPESPYPPAIVDSPKAKSLIEKQNAIDKSILDKAKTILKEQNTKDTNPKDLIGQTKLQTWLVPPSAKIALAEALTDGANKYGPFNWREKGVRATVYIAAAERHVMSYLDGEDSAEDSGVHHLAHAMACFAILLDAIAQGNIVDDRPIKGASPALLKAIHLKNEEKNKAK